MSLRFQANYELRNTWAEPGTVHRETCAYTPTINCRSLRGPKSTRTVLRSSLVEVGCFCDLPGSRIYIARRVSWHGTRIVLRQASAEACAIFDLVLSLHQQFGPDWEQRSQQLGIDLADLRAFIDYAACFLSNVGNYCVGFPTACEHIC